MIFNLCGRHESDLNFSVIVSASAPTQGVAPGVIWVKSDAACTYIQMIDDATKWSSPPDGAVAIICAAANTSNAWMTAIKSHPMYVRTFGCYQRISGAWVSMDAYMWSNAGSWAQFSYAFYATISVTWPAGSTCAIANGDTRLVAPTTSGSYTFTVTKAGTWVVSCTDGTNTASGSVSITASGQRKSVSLSYNKIPAFTYTGEYKIVNDSGTEISETATNNWNIRLLTSGTLTFTDLRGTSAIDLFLVGGGGGSNSKTVSTDYGTVHSGGGGGGYTKTQKSVRVSANSAISVSIGAGGGAGSSGGTTTVKVNGSSYSASGGAAGGAPYWNGSNTVCGAGGSGGSGGGAASSGGFAGGSGGSNGGNGSGGRSNVFPTSSAGSGQGTTTRAFGESSGELYSYGGSGGGGTPPVVGTLAANTGHGGQGSGGSGYSGIAIIRGHR